jgi:hypothetical protein
MLIQPLLKEVPMFDLHKQNLSEKHAKKLDELTSKFERTENLLNNLLAQHELSHEEFAGFLANPNHFEPAAWEEMQKARKQLSQKLELELKSIKNPHSTGEKYKALKQASQWMLVR